MEPGLSELALPAGRGARAVALRLLDEASAAAPRVAAGDDDEALHDFRVAVRRLRSWVRAFKDEFGDAVPKKARRRLKDLAQATNPARDRQVHREWLRQANAKSRGAQRAAAVWLARDFDRGDADDRAKLAAAINDEFPKVRDSLAKSLAKDFAVADGAPAPFAVEPPTLGVAIAERVVPHAQALAEAASHIHSVADEAAAHAARIAAKQLRYLIEPARDVAEGAVLLKRLRGVQDALGDLHDAHVMVHELSALLMDGVESDARRVVRRALGRELGRAAASATAKDARYANFPKDGIVALLRTLRADIGASFATAAARCSGDAAQALAAEAEALAARLRG